jgi:mRNA-degrading endonuclease toxin of MazEF toxin-antitoxin module
VSPTRGEVWLYERPCALALDNTFPPSKALLTRRIAKLGPEKMAEVCRALRIATAC